MFTVKNVIYKTLFAFCLFVPLHSAVAETQCGEWISLSSSPTSPPPRIRHSFAYNAGIKKGVLFGGTGITGNALVVLGDTWLWNSQTKTWEGPMSHTVQPSARFGSSMAYDSARDVVVLFGGAGSDGLPLGDTWEFDGTSWKQILPATSPDARVFHAIGFDSVRGQVILVGGLNGSELLEDTWVWNGVTWAKLSESGPGVRELHSLTYDELQNKTVVFGGYQSAGYLGDTWELGGLNWESTNVSGPTARIESPFTYEPKLQKSVLFGGITQEGQYLADTWTWNGEVWEQLQLSAPSARRGAAATYDTQLPGIILFGGTDESGAIFNDTWLFSVADKDKDGFPDCTDQCPADPIKNLPGICGCGSLESGSSCAPTTLVLKKPKRPVLKMVKKEVRLQMQSAPNVRYLVRYYKVVKGKKKPVIKTTLRTTKTFNFKRLKNGSRYVVRYQHVSKINSTVRSKFSSPKEIKVSFRR